MSSNHDAKLVLYAEDDEDARLLFKRAFSKSGVQSQLHMVDDGSTAIEYLSGAGENSDRHKFPLPDLLLLDLKMRSVSGFGVLEYLKSRKEKLTCPVIIFSSSEQDTDKKRAKDLGSDAYWVKPSSFEALIELVKKMDATYLNSDTGHTSLKKPAVPLKNPPLYPLPVSLEPLSTNVLSESPQIFRFLVEQVKDYAIFMLSTEGIILSWNEGARQIKGYEAQEIIGKHFGTFYPQVDLDNDKPQTELRIAADMGRYEEEGWRLRKDGSRFWANVVITSLWDKRGNLTGYAKVTRDLTDRKREEDSLKQKTQELEAFAHTLSHDLKSPLRSISSFAQILKTEADDLTGEERTGYVDKISRAAASMSQLIDGLLRLSQVGSAEAPVQTISLEAILREAMMLLESDIKSTKAEIQIPTPLPDIQANPILMLQIVSNLLSNAIKFRTKGEVPKIEIFVSCGEELCEIHVKDNGIGIFPQFLDSVFEIFERAGADSEGNPGMGVGLAIVKRAVERMSGKIEVKSERGRGSEFIVTLPSGNCGSVDSH